MEKRVCATPKRRMALLALLVMVPTIAWATEDFRGGGFRQGPPQEAVEACAGKKEGEAVRFKTPFGDNVSGVCREVRGKLIAVPEGGFSGPPPVFEGKGPRGNIVRVIEALDLTKEQKEHVRRIIDAERGKTESLERQLAETREKLRKVMEAEPFDEGAVRVLAAGQEKTRVELFLSRALAERRILAVLTPEQRKAVQILRKILPDMQPPFLRECRPPAP